MKTVNLYADTNCNSGTCGRVIPWVDGRKKESIEATTLREAVDECHRRWPGCEVKLEGLAITESQLSQIVGGFTQHQAKTMGVSHDAW